MDIVTTIGAVRREVAARDHEGRPARAVVAERTYDAPIDDVWDAVTSAERIPRWLLPISGDLRLGGHYQLEGNAGGTITACEPPAHLAATWEFGGEVTWIDVVLVAGPDGGTTVRLEHIAHVDDERWGEFGPGAVGVGWDLSIQGLVDHLAGHDLDGAAWLSSPDGIEFIGRSSDDWCRAAIAAGSPPEQARAAAARTTAAYTAAE